MIRFAGVMFIGLILCNCSPHVSPPDQQNFFVPEDSLWELKINRWGKERFSGLLALRTFDSKLSLVVLDATGIKLLAGIVSPTGSMQVTQSMQTIQDHHLPEYMNNSLRSVFWDPPIKTDSCAYSGVIQICHKKTAAHTILKEARLGPFLIWSVSYLLDGDAREGIIQSMTYNPWQGTQMSLQFLSRQEGTSKKQ